MDIAIRINGTGGSEVLEKIKRGPHSVGAGEVLVRQQAIGVNFIDVYHRTGLYPLPAPHIPGVEGAGIVEAVGAEVEGVKVGDRVAYAGVVGAYQTLRVIPAWRALRLPQEVPMKLAGANMLRAYTAYMLLHVTYPLTSGNVVLVHSAAGVLGTILTRWAKQMGAVVIGTASSEEKADYAKRNGADIMIIGRDAALVESVREFTQGRGADFVIDGVGGEMVRKSLKCVRPFGMVASIGWVAGPVRPLGIEELGLAQLSKPSVMGFTADRHLYEKAARHVMHAFASGIVPEGSQAYPLSKACDAHNALEDGRSHGALVLVP